MCKYCETKGIGSCGEYFFKGSDEGFHISQEPDGFYINYLNHNKDVHDGIEIKYCPMCSRELRT